MRLRTTAHRASPASSLHEVGERSVRLLPLDLFRPSLLKEVQDKIEAADVDTKRLGAGQASFAAAAIILYHCWDDPDVEWEADLDPDAIVNLEGSALLDAGAALCSEMLARPVYRLGIVPFVVGDRMESPSLLRAAFMHNAGLIVMRGGALGEAQPPAPTN